MRILGSVTPCIFEDDLIIALSLDWIMKFNQVPTFRIIIDDENRLSLIVPEIVKKND